MGICKPLGSLNSFLSYVLQVSGTTSCFLIVTSLIPCSPWGMAEDSCFLHSSELLCNHCRGGSICWVTGIVFPFGSPHSHLEARNSWWLGHFLFIDMVGDISFHKVMCSYQVRCCHTSLDLLPAGFFYMREVSTSFSTLLLGISVTGKLTLLLTDSILPG